MKPPSWSKLNKQQAGAYAEYFVKMQLTLCGFQVYRTEVDDRGVDFVARYEKGPFIEIQVKSVRTANYVFVEKRKFEPAEELYLALVFLREGEEPSIYLVPSTRWLVADQVFVSRDYDGLKSAPEWGLNLSKRNLPALQPFGIDHMLDELKKRPNKSPEPTPTAVTPRADDSGNRK